MKEEEKDSESKGILNRGRKMFFTLGGLGHHNRRNC